MVVPAHPVLDGYCRAVRATCCLVRDLVLAGCVCEVCPPLPYRGPAHRCNARPPSS